MKETTRWWLVHITHWVMLYAAFWQQLEGAMYVVQFFTWVNAALLPFVMTKKAIADFAKKPPRAWTSEELTWLQAWITLIAMVWSGHIATAIAWSWVMGASAWRNEEVSKLREQALAT